jgi:ATP-dependent DNA ligase
MAQVKCLSRQEFVIVGWTDPEGSGPHVRAPARLLRRGRSIALRRRVGTGMSERTMATLHKRLKPLVIQTTPLAASPPRDNRFGRPLELAKTDWVRPELVVGVAGRQARERGPADRAL